MPFAGMGGYYAVASMAGWNAATITPTIALASGIGCVEGSMPIPQETARAGSMSASASVSGSAPRSLYGPGQRLHTHNC